MACCLFLLRLLAPLATRLGIETNDTRAPRVPVVPLAVLGLLEIVLAVVLVSVSRGTTPVTTNLHLHHAAAGSGLGSLQLWLSVFLTGAVVLAGLRLAGRSTHPAALLGSALAIATTVAAFAGPFGHSHLAMMVVVEVGLVVVPLAVIGAEVNTRPSPDVWTAMRAALCLAAALGVVAILVTLHLPSSHLWYVSPNGIRWWLSPVVLLVGFAFWVAVMRFRLPAPFRTLMLILVLETGSIIGLVFLVAGQDLLPALPGSSIGPVADQRLAGGLMMVVDLVLLARVIHPAFLRNDLAPAASPLAAATHQ